MGTLTAMSEMQRKQEVRLDEGGLWAVRSTSATVCFLDLDRMTRYRDRGAGSPSFPYDRQWVPLVQVRSPRGDTGVVRVGDRHEFVTDPDEGSQDYQWWIPRLCIAIEPVDPADAPPRR